MADNNEQKIAKLSKDIENLANKSDRIDAEAKKEREANGRSKKYFQLRIQSEETMLDCAKKKAERYKLKGGGDRDSFWNNSIKDYEDKIKSLKADMADSNKSESKTYTDRDALRDHKASIAKKKARLKALQDEIKSDMEMIKDKEEKMKSASDEPGRNGVPSPKKMYANNIARLKARIQDTNKTIKEVQDDIKDSEKKHKEAEADVKRIEAKKSSKGESMKLAKKLTSVIESLNADGDVETTTVENPLKTDINDECECKGQDGCECDQDENAGETTIEDDGEFVIEEEDEEDDSEEDNIMSEEEMDAEIEKDMKDVTEEEIEAEKDDIEEAASTYPGSKKIKAMQVLVKKQRAKYQAAKADYVKQLDRKKRFSKKSAGSKDPKAEAKRKLDYKAANKGVKEASAKKEKALQIVSRANAQLQKLIDDRKAYNKKNREAKK